jgi:hypothetical protein
MSSQPGFQDSLNSWQSHVIQCGVCGSAATANDLCQMGKNFWRVPGSASMPMQQPQPVSVVVAPIVQMPPMPMYGAPVPNHPQAQSQHAMMTMSSPGQAFDMNVLSQRVLDRVVARSSSGAAISISREKTSTSVEFSTANGVVLRMPERDIEVYSCMKTMIGKLLRHAEQIGTYMMAREEGKRFAREVGKDLTSDETAMIVAQVGRRRGMGELSPEVLYDEFSVMCGDVMKLGDVIARFMTVDSDTRFLMKDVRALGVEMQGELERSSGGCLALDEATPKIVKQMRMLTVSLQSEMERRLGT